MKRVVVAVGLLLVSMPVAVAALITGPSNVGGPPTAFAQQEVPADLLPVYMSAALTCPGLPWQVLAGIGWVESRHADGRADPATGDVVPPIVGPPLDGRRGLAAIPDATEADGWAHARGPMQFLPETWRTWGVVAPDRAPGATPDVQNAWDSIYSAVAYLCDGRLTVGDIHAALLRYNKSEDYARQVRDKAVEYGLGSPASSSRTYSGTGEAVIAAAMTQLGVPYAWGGEAPGTGFDCSGLVQWAYAQIGVQLPRTTQQQVLVGNLVAITDLRPGDLIFSRTVGPEGSQDFGHVAIYTGGATEIVAPHTGAVVSVRPVVPDQVQAVRRVLSDS